MVSAKPWKLDAIMRLILGVFVCVFSGSLLLAALHCAATGRASLLKIYLPFLASLGFLGATLALLRKPWDLDNVLRRLTGLFACFYAGLVLGAWVQKVSGWYAPSVLQMVVTALSFQGAALILITLFLREHQVNWRAAFGLGQHWPRALLLGFTAACLFLPAGLGLQWLSAKTFLPWLHLEAGEQQAVQTLQMADSWSARVVLGVITILLVPPAEETLFRGILYPAIKQAGFPRLALWGTSLLFAAVHFHLPTLLPLFALALILALLYERTDNLLAPITAHALFNALNFALLYFVEWKLDRPS